MAAFLLKGLTFDYDVKVDLTAYVEKHEFCFDAVLDEHVSNDEVTYLVLGAKANIYRCFSVDISYELYD